MISKGEAIQRLKKMGVAVADDQSMVTILLPSDRSFSAGVKDAKEKLKAMEYEASFCIRQEKMEKMEKMEKLGEGEKQTFKEKDSVWIMGEENHTSEENSNREEEPFDEEDDFETLSEEDLKGSLLSMDEDGQFSLGGFGLDF